MKSGTERRRGRDQHHLSGHPETRGLLREHEPAEQPPRHRLERLLAPALGLLDAGAGDRVAGKQGRIGSELVEEARDRAGALHLRAVQLQRRHRVAIEPGEPHEDRVEAGHDRHDAVRDPFVPHHRRSGGRRIRHRHDVDAHGHQPQRRTRRAIALARAR
jgi:hypothetical protein